MSAEPISPRDAELLKVSDAADAGSRAGAFDIRLRQLSFADPLR